MKTELRKEQVVLKLKNRVGTVDVNIHEPESVWGSVFCFHGFIGSGSDFDELAAFLVGNGLRVVCPDMPGRGTSTYFADPDIYKAPTYMEITRLLVTRYGTGRVIFIGSGWGATIALLFTQLANFTPNRLILCDLIFTGSAKLNALSQLLMELLNREFDSPDDADRFWQEESENLGLVTGSTASPSLVKNLVRTGDRYRLSCDKMIAYSLDFPPSFDLSPMLKSARAPTLALYGRSNPFLNVEILKKVAHENNNFDYITEIGEYNTIVLDNIQICSIIYGFVSTISPKS